MKFETVDRVATKRSGRGGLAAALRETLTNGKAILVPLEGASVLTVRTRISGSIRAARTGGSARICTRKVDDGIVAWMEPRESK